MKKTHYARKPEPLLIQHQSGYVHVELALNPVELPPDSETEPATWEADTHEFWEQEGVLDLDALRAQPEAYLHYIPHATRQVAKDRAQQMLDTLRSGNPVVPVPSYRAGAAVCNRPADQVKLVAGLAMGGLPYYELANGDVVNLSEDDIKAIAADVAKAETAWQQAKQQCWQNIEAAEGANGIEKAIEEFAAQLSPYATPASSGTLGTGNNKQASGLSSLLKGWGLRESWAQLLAGALAGALATAGMYPETSPEPPAEPPAASAAESPEQN